MKLLVAEDHQDTSLLYKMTLEDRGHEVRIENNGEDSLKNYQKEFQNITLNTDPAEHIPPYDSVILDYKLPKINGIEVGNEILAINPRQRIIFASAYPLTEESLIKPVEGIRHDIDILSKPFTPQTLVDKVESRDVYSELQKLNVDIDCIKVANFRHDQLRDMLRILKRES
jgi:DNA-binding response OmpR family regulator